LNEDKDMTKIGGGSANISDYIPVVISDGGSVIISENDPGF
jgi:hypothetical protein